MQLNGKAQSVTAIDLTQCAINMTSSYLKKTCDHAYQMLTISISFSFAFCTVKNIVIL